MRLHEVLSLARGSRRAFLRVSDPDRLYRLIGGDIDAVEYAFMPQWEYLAANEQRIRDMGGDFFAQPWRQDRDGWWSSEVLADDWVLETEERP